MELGDKKKIEEMQIVVFSIGNEEYGVEIHKIREIIKIPDITIVPNTPEFIEGIINLRGKIVVVFSMAKRMNLITEDEATRIIISDINNNTFGMVVDAVTEVMTINKDDIKDAPAIISEKIHSKYLDGVAISDDRLIILLNLENMLSDKELTEAAKFARKISPRKKEEKKEKVHVTEAQVEALAKKKMEDFKTEKPEEPKEPEKKPETKKPELKEHALKKK